MITARLSTLAQGVLLCAFIGGLHAAVHAEPLVSFDFSDFSGPVTSSGGTVGVSNAGSTGATGNGTVEAFGNGTVTATTGPAGSGDVALQFNDANTGTGVNAQGGQLAWQIPAITSDFTYAFSIRPDGPQTAYDHVLEFPDDPNIQGNQNVYFDNTPDGLTLRFRVGNRMEYYTLTADQWQHVTLVYDANGYDGSDGQYKIFINGSLAETSLNVDPDDAHLSDSAATIYAGSQSSGNRPFNGGLDNLVIYDQTLTDQQVADLAASTVPEPGSMLAFSLLTSTLLIRRRRHA